MASSVAQTTPRTTPTPTSTLLFQVGADQARFVATVVAFFDAMNAGVEAAALSLVTENVVGGDCDPTKELPAVGGPATRSFGNKAAFAGWLRERVRDQERWEIGQIVNENPEPTTGSRVVAVGFTRRTSDPLRASGRPDGVHPGGAAKIVFTTDGRQIIALALPCT
ncbi:MAG: hypothetical protein HYX56_02520 [Chloroflexi bacterium]|nr:hypothetical protein [Chloroflexota bacterium]